MLSLAEINDLDEDAFVRTLGPLFEHSSWVAGTAWHRRPFGSVSALHGALVESVAQAPRERQLALIDSHPELGGRATRRGELTAESTREQASAGLAQLPSDEADALGHLNRAYRERFGFPLIVCAREHTPDSILAYGAARLEHSREEEIDIALGEIAKIAELRLRDAVFEDPAAG